MKLRHIHPITITIDGYLSAFYPYQVGLFGCPPCPCGNQPAPGDLIWCNNFAHLRCNPCATADQGVTQ